MKNKKILLPNKAFIGAIDENINLNVHFENEQNIIREGDRNIIINNSELFDKERNESIDYKIHGKIKVIFSNSYSGTTSYGPLKKRLYLNGDGSNGDFSGYIPYDEFAFIRRDILRYDTVPQEIETLGQYTQNIILKGKSNHKDVNVDEANKYNWNINLSYIFNNDESFPLTYTLENGEFFSFKSSDGIPFKVYDDGRYYKLVSDVEHGIKFGEYIIISGTTLNNNTPERERIFFIEDFGDETYNSNNFILYLNKSEFSQNTTLPNFILGKRCIDINRIEETTSKYYVHKHKIITSENDYILENIGFESSIWSDRRKVIFENSEQENNVIVEKNRMESLFFVFETPFQLSGLTNNLKYTPTEIYITVTLKNTNGYFTYPPKIGYKFNIHDSWIDKNFENYDVTEFSLKYNDFTNSGFTFSSGETPKVNDEFIGAYVEYNREDLKERIISEAYHKFSISKDLFDFNQTNSDFYSGATQNNMVGWLYQPHYRLKLRELSPYIETSITNQIFDLPQNAIFFEKENLWKWRDVYNHGYIDSDGNGTNFPFLNNMHYVKTDINFYIRSEKDYLSKKNGIVDFNDKKTSIC